MIWIFFLLISFIYAYHPSHHKLSFNKQPSSFKLSSNRVPLVPYYPNTNDHSQYLWMDLYNAFGRQKRTIFVSQYLDNAVCNTLIASLIWLQGKDQDESITLYFNCPGGDMKSALAVADVMKQLKCPIKTYNVGLTVGMGAILFSLGTKNERYAFPNSRFLMSKTGLYDGIEGSAVDVSLTVKDIMNDNIKVLNQLSLTTKQSYDKILSDFERDFYLTAPEACSYGIVDHILEPSQNVKLMIDRGEHNNNIKYGHFTESDSWFRESHGKTKHKINRNKASSSSPTISSSNPLSRFADARAKPPEYYEMLRKLQEEKDKQSINDDEEDEEDEDEET